MENNCKEKIYRGIVCCLASLSICSGCTPMQKWLQPQHKDMQKNQKIRHPDINKVQKIKLYQYTIRWPGETLSIISKWYTGSVNNWKIIALTNPKIHANSLGIGTILLIPADIVIRHQSMPQTFLIKFKKKRPNGKQTKKKVPVDDLELFGPID